MVINLMHYVVVYGPCGRCGEEHAWEAFSGVSFDEGLAVGVGYDWLRQFPLDIVMIARVGDEGSTSGEEPYLRDQPSGPERPRSLDLRKGCP